MAGQAPADGRVRKTWICIGLCLAILAPAVFSASARAASPVLEFVSPSTPFPVAFTADGGAVSAALADFDPEVNCTDSEGEGELVGPRAAVAQWVFTGCQAQGGGETGHACNSEGADPEEIKTGKIEAELVFIDQAKHQVGMLLNPGGGVYMDFKCGGEAVDASGPFLSPIGTINQLTSSFTAILTRSGATQTPSEFENALGETRQAIPMGKRESQPAATTGVELSFAIHTSAPIEVKAVTAAEIEAKQREELAAVAKKRADEEAATAAAIKLREDAEVRIEQLRRAEMRSKGLIRCRKLATKQKRVSCEKKVKRKYARRGSGQ